MSSPGPRGPGSQEIGALVALVNHDRLREAESAALGLLRSHPEAGMLWKVLSIALLRQGKDALPALRRTAELLPGDAEAQGNLGEALFDGHRWAESLESLQKALALAPEDVNLLLHAADASRELGRVAESLPMYHRALRLEPRSRRALNNLGNAYLQLRQFADAAGHYRLALEVAPDEAQIWCNLGTAQRILGFLDEALLSTRRAIALEPASSSPHNHLGLILVARGDREGAIASYRQALILDSNDVDALNNLAHVLRDVGLRRDAIALYARAIRSNPDRADSHCNLGMALFEARRIDDAVAAFHQALALQPNHAPAHLNLGVALRQKRLPDEAQASCRAALAIDPNYVDALVFLGELLADRGQFTAADEQFQKALSINPAFAPALSGIATHRRMTLEDADWARRAEALLAHPLTVSHEIGLHYSLGKYLDDIRRYDSAFEHYRLAHELSKRLVPDYDDAKLARYISGIERTFDAAFLRQQRPDSARGEAPILIVGMPRSGTSLAEQILASHPAVFGAGELTFWNSAYQAYRDADGGGAAAVLGRKAAEYATLLGSISGGAQRVVDKLPANFLYIGMIHAAFPHARIIHMQRHPIDTCLSIYFQNFFNIGPYANDLTTLAQYYRQYTRIMNHWRDVMPATALLEVPYEGLLEDQEGWTRRMLEFSGLGWDPACLEFDRTERVVITASKWQVRQKIHKSSAGRWRHYERFLGPLLPLQELIPSR
jgi:tetratricopeptide (TPR) repeat protein